MKNKQYTLEVSRSANSEIIYSEDYYSKQELKNDLLMFNRVYCYIKIYFSKFDGTDEFIELDVDRF